MRQSSLMWSRLLVVVVLGLAINRQLPAAEQRRWHTIVLDEHQISTSAENVLKELRKRVQPVERQDQANRLIARLGSNSYDEREQASAQLLQLGGAARQPLAKALRSPDLEIVHRAREILAQLESGELQRKEQIVLHALLREAAARNLAGAMPLALELLPILEEPALRHAAQETVWHCVQPVDRPVVERAMSNKWPDARGAALVASERLDKARSLGRAVPMLADDAIEVRLAACRALLPYQPQACLPVLVDIVGSAESDCSAEAWKLLRAAIGKHPQRSESEDARVAWQKLIATEGRSIVPGKVRDADRLWWGTADEFVESFDLAADVRKTYGRFRYRSTLDADASVKGGLLRLDGQHEEADQWLEIDAAVALGQPEFPRRLRVSSRLGGEADGAGGYHLGIVIGNLKVLMHPAYPGAGLRIERDDNHQYLSDTESVEITPEAATLYNLEVEVAQRPDLSADVTVTLSDNATKPMIVRRIYSVKGEDIGRLNRVALVRSGRSGGAALFDRLQITPLP